MDGCWFLVVGYWFPEKCGKQGGLSDGMGCFLKRRAYIGFWVPISREWALWLSWLSEWICRTKVLRQFVNGVPLQYSLI